MAPIMSTLRTLSAGDVILDIKPVVHIVYNELKDKYCNNCLKYSEELKRCTKCLQMYYCDKNCQRIDWKYHKNECKVLANKKFKIKETLPFEILLIRLWLIIKSEETFVAKQYKLIDGSDISIGSIEVKLDDLSQDVNRMIQFQLICNHFKSFGIEFVRKELLHWFGLITSSAISQEFVSYSQYKGIVLNNQTVGLGLYPELYGVSHSCLPNSIVVFNDLSLQLRANKSIAVGTQITRSYVYLGQNKSKRQKFLREKYFINGCNCSKCEGNDLNVDYNKLEKLCSKQNQDMTKPFSGLNLSDPTADIEEFREMRELSTKAMGEYDPILTDILIVEFIQKQSSILLNRAPIPGIQSEEYYQRLKDHIRVTYGVNHPVYIQTHRPDNPFIRLG